MGKKKEEGLHFIHLDLEDIHSKCIDPIYAHDFDINNFESLNQLNDLLHTTQEGDHLNAIPTCACKENPIVGFVNIDVICQKCNQPVSAFVGNMDNRLWLHANEKMYKFISPTWWSLLAEHFKMSRQNQPINYLHWFADRRYRMPDVFRNEEAQFKAILETIGKPRCWRTFVDHFVDIIKELSTRNLGRRLSKGFIRYIESNQAIIFTRFLPLPSSSILVKEKTNTAIYADTTIIGVIDGSRTIYELYFDEELYSDEKFESKLVSAMISISEGYVKFDDRNLLKKESLIRSAVISGRMDRTGRAVIKSQTGMHDFNELKIPRAMALTVWRPELVEMYMRDGHRPTPSIMTIENNMYTREPVLDRYLTAYIAQGETLKYSTRADGSPIVGRTCFIHRNPALKIGSQQRQVVTGYNPNPLDWTIGISAGILTDCNADRASYKVNVFHHS